MSASSSYAEIEEFNDDVAWIKKNHKACELVTSKAYEDFGRGALVVSVKTPSIPDRAHSFRYFSQKQVNKNLDGPAKSAVKEYDHSYQFVLVLLMPEKRAVAYTLFRKRRLDSGELRRTN